MPGKNPKHTSGLIRADKSARVKTGNIFDKTRIGLIGSTALGGLLSSVSAVLAADAVAEQSIFSSVKERLLQSLESTDILMLAVFGGAMSFALMSASWLIRERGHMITESQNLRSSLADLRANNDRNEALVNIPDQRIVVWNGTDEKPCHSGCIVQRLRCS